MSDDHDHDHEQAAPAPATAAHDARLDASGAEHPAVKPSSFDLIALEHTRSGLRLLGVGLCLWSFAHPLVAQLLSEAPLAAARIGWSLNALAQIALLAAVWIMAPTPQGPLPRMLGYAISLVFLVQLATSGLRLVSLFNGFAPEQSVRDIVRISENVGRIACLMLPWILWRFCQFRGLTGRAIVWLWFAMASSGLAIAVSFSEVRWLLFLFPPLGVIAYFAAQQSARDVWLDAIYRNTRFHVVLDKSRAVEPLRPANER